MTGLRSNLKIGPLIGEGFFGQVFLAQDDVHGSVAVKVLKQRAGELDSDWQVRKAGLLAEGQRLSQAAHLNVVRVHYLVEDNSNDAVCLVMEFCGGGSLQTPFDTGPTPLADVLKYATSVTLGLQALHMRDMLHRDIKPSNLMRTDKGIVKLGDFGLVTDNIILGYASQQGYGDHLAPEIWAGGGTSVKTDIWALGMTIYRLLHGAQWYSRSPPPSQVIPTGGFANSIQWLPHIPKHWRRVIRKMLNDDPHSRYQTVTEVMSALATLSSDPDWNCVVTDTQVRWRRSKGGRRIRVMWTTHSPRKHEWSAWSEPVGAGRRRTLGGSKDKVGYTDVVRELQDFFSS